MTTTEELDKERAQLDQDLAATRARVTDLTDRRGRAQERLMTLKAERDAALAVADPEAKTATTRRRALLDAELELEEFDAAVVAAEARVAGLEAATAALTRRYQARVLLEMLERSEDKAAAFMAAQEAANRELALFLRAQADCEQLAEQLLPRPTRWATPGCEIRPLDLVRAALWRLLDLIRDRSHDLELPYGPLGRIDAALRRPLIDYWRDRWARTRERAENLLRGEDDPQTQNGGGSQ